MEHTINKPQAAKDGTVGFSPNLSGHGKADHSGTSGFGGKETKVVAVPVDNQQPGQEENGARRNPSTSAAARIVKE